MIIHGSSNFGHIIRDPYNLSPLAMGRSFLTCFTLQVHAAACYKQQMLQLLSVFRELRGSFQELAQQARVWTQVLQIRPGAGQMGA